MCGQKENILEFQTSQYFQIRWDHLSLLLFSSKQACGKHEGKGKWGVLQFRHGLNSNIQVYNITPWTKSTKQQRGQYSSAKPLLSVRKAGWYLCFVFFFKKNANNITWCAFQNHFLHSGEQRCCCCAYCLQGWREVAISLPKMQDKMGQASPVCQGVDGAVWWLFSLPDAFREVNRTVSSLTLQRLLGVCFQRTIQWCSLFQ